MDIKRNGSQPSGRGPRDRSAPDRGSASTRFIQPSKPTGWPRTSRHVRAWHRDSLARSTRGQNLLVTATTTAQRYGDSLIEEIRPGDVVLVPAGREALAWRLVDDRHDAHRHSGTTRWQGGGLDEPVSNKQYTAR